MRDLLVLLPLTILLMACPSDDGLGDDDDTPADQDCGGAERVVTFETSDGETLEADYIPGTTRELGAVVLFHMVPPANDRSGYPSGVRQAFADAGVAVLNVDRRGAGGSTGNPLSAYQGIGGRLDMEASVDFVLSGDRECPADGGRLALVGASNGTTAVMDYIVGVQTDLAPDHLPPVAAAVWLSPGNYTELQNPIGTDWVELGYRLDLPLLWVYPTNEAFSGTWINGAPDTWEFLEIGTAHGTNLFDGGDVEETVLGAATSWVEAAQ